MGNGWKMEKETFFCKIEECLVIFVTVIFNGECYYYYEYYYYLFPYVDVYKI